MHTVIQDTALINLSLFKRRTVWCPTLIGWICIFAIFCAPVLFWWFRGELFLSQTERLPADVLVVESWIGIKGMQAAAAEFKQGGYQYVVTTGGLSSPRWAEQRWSYSGMGAKELARDGVPEDKIIVASAEDAETQRTYESAVAVWKALQVKGIQPKALNVFTLGCHARRSHMVFEKVLQPGIQVGVIAWSPGYESTPWWSSSERAEDFVKETASTLYEFLWDCGRKSNSPAASAH